MPKFSYTAVGPDGKKETSTIEAASLMAAGHLLKEQGLMPMEVEETKENSALTFLRGFSSVPLKQKIVFIQNLQIMLKSGIAAPRALKIIARQTKNRKFKTILEDVGASVEQGKNLHEAMGKYPNVFSHIFITMVKVGELSGNLEKSLEYLGIQLEREADLKSKTLGAMIYPSVIVGAMLIIGVLMSIFVLPKLLSTFTEMGAALPLQTRIVIAVVNFMSGNAILVIGAIIVVVIGFIFGLRTKQGQRALDWFLLHFPVLSSIVKKINLARFSRVLSSMMKSGIAIVEALEVTAESLGNAYYREIIESVSEKVRLGKPLTESLQDREKLFPFIIVQMLEVGEETGTLETIMEQLAVHYEAEVDTTLRNLSSIIEPLLLLIIGGVVGLLAVALIGPIYNISQNIS